MTDTSPEIEPEALIDKPGEVPCSKHEHFDPDCPDCLDLKEDLAIKGPRELAQDGKQYALFTRDRMREDCTTLGERVGGVASTYGELLEFAYTRQIFGTSGVGNVDGSERDVAAVLVTTAEIRRRLGAVCEAVTFAHNSISRAAAALDKARDVIERARPDELEQSEQYEREREKPATRTQQAESQYAKERALLAAAAENERRASIQRSEATRLHRSAEALERRVKADARRAAEVQARKSGAAPLSKSQRKRARRNTSAYVASPLQRLADAAPSAGEQIDEMRRLGNLPKADQTSHLEGKDN